MGRWIVTLAWMLASVTLSWDANTDPVAGYNVYRSTQSGSYSSPALNPQPITETTYTDSPSDGTYFYVVKAVNDAGIESDPSNEVQVTVGSALAPPIGLTAQCSADGKSVTVVWQPVLGAQSYYLRVDDLANNVNGQWFVDGRDYNLDAYPQTTFTATVVPGDAYQWWVHPANSVVGIGPSTSAMFTCGVPAPPPVVTISIN